VKELFAAGELPGSVHLYSDKRRWLLEFAPPSTPMTVLPARTVAMGIFSLKAAR
jgi:hypothetical protein